jgi:hypothetical protein
MVEVAAMKKLDQALEFFEHVPLGTAEEERARAIAWAETALLHHRLEKSWESRAVTAEAALRRSMAVHEDEKLYSTVDWTKNQTSTEKK